MSTLPLAATRYRAFDADGDPLSGGKLYAYAAGTSTPQATYTTRAGDIANTNPVVLDANGEADVWLSPGVNYRLVLKDSSDVIQNTVDNFGNAVVSGVTDNSGVTPGGRLTLTSGTPITTGDVTGATTLYYAPYKSDVVSLYDGSTWALYSIGSGLSQTTTDNTKSPASVANSSNYDIFVWNDAGTVRLSRGPAWSSSTARGTGVGTTELQQVNGRYVNKNTITNGPATLCGLYVGTVRSDGSAQLNDTKALRFVWNTYNRVQRQMLVQEATSSWSYDVTSWRQVNGSAANQLSVIRGLDEDAMRVQAAHAAFHTSVNANFSTGIGLDSTTAPDAACLIATAAAPYEVIPREAGPTAFWSGLPGLGLHALTWLERPAFSTSSNTWLGVATGTKAGISGEALA